MSEDSYLSFRENRSPSGKTKIVDVNSKDGVVALGTIKWHGPWRKYVFAPFMNTLFDAKCMKELIDKMDSLMKERRDGES